MRACFMTLVTLLAAFLFFPKRAFASEACSTLTDGQNGAPVVFFGGWLASESDGQKWVDGARATAQQTCGGRFKFEGHGLNGAGSDINSVEKKMPPPSMSAFERSKTTKVPTR